MVHVLNIEDVIQEVVGEALEADHAEGEVHDGLEMFTALRREFPQATIVTLSLSEILEAVYTSVQSTDE